MAAIRDLEIAATALDDRVGKICVNHELRVSRQGCLSRFG